MLQLIALWAAVAIPCWLYVSHLHKHGKRVKKTGPASDHTTPAGWGL